jgi:GntR family transcriptional regulator
VVELLATIGPAAERVRRQLLDQIHAGLVPPGERLGAERDLAQALGVSRSTVRQALAALEKAGEVRRVPGRGGGTFVRSRKVERDLSRVVGVPALLRAQGMTSGSRVISTGIASPDPETAAALHLTSEELVVDVVRIRLADGTPISLEHVRLPAERFPRLLDQPLGGSLYDLLEEHYDTVPGEAEERIEVTPAGQDEASILGTEPGAPLLSITRTTKDSDGVVFEHSHDLFRADRTMITVRTPASTRPGRQPARVVALRSTTSSTEPVA